MRTRRHATTLILALALSGLPESGWWDPAAGKEPSLEYQVKAAFLLNFTKFIEWPAADAADATFSMCIVGADPFEGALDRMVEGESVNGRRLVVRRVSRAQADSCQMVFAGEPQDDMEGLLAELGRGVLTVGEGPRFLREGGMITFIIANRHVRFDVNLGAAAHAGLKISSKLLTVARRVER